MGFSLAVWSALGIWLSAVAAPAQQPTPQPASSRQVSLSLDLARSYVHFTVATTLHTVHGEFAFKPSSIQFDPATGKVTGEIVVDAASGQSGDTLRDKRMHKEVLESSRFSEVAFRPDRISGKVALSGSSAIQLHGTFTLHGTDHDLTVPVQVNLSGDHWQGTASFGLPYVQWGLKNPGNFLLKVSPTVNIDLEMAGSLQSPRAP